MKYKSLVFFATLFLCQFELKAQWPNPPNTIQFGTTFYVDKSEVANIHWLEFLHNIKQDSSSTYYRSVLPDTTLIVKIFPNGEILNNADYIKTEALRYYPILGLNYKQASDYCKWRSAVVNNNWGADNTIDTSVYRIEYRLPAIAEWEAIALANNYNALIPKSRKIKRIVGSTKRLTELLLARGKVADKDDLTPELIQFYQQNPIYLFENLAYATDDKDLLAQLPFSFPDVTHKADDDQIEDLRGNVSEMTTTKGIAKGGNWKSKPGSVSLTDEVNYLYPSELIGFRCVCEIIEKK